MCLILEIPDGAEPLSEAEARDVWARNKDGACVIDTRTGEILYRGLDFDAATATIVGQTGIVVHWRRGTSGRADDEHIHGWAVGSCRLLHNGVLASWATRTRSDTLAIVEALVSAGVDPIVDAAAALIQGLAAHTTIVLAPIAGGAPRWYGNDRNWTVWRGRIYSNRYAWTGTVHGKPPPPPPPPPRHVVTDPRYPYSAQGALWTEDDLLAFFADDTALPTSKKRGR